MMFGPRHQWKWRIPLTNKWQSRFWAFELLLPVAPLGLLMRSESAFLHTCRPAGAFKGWCAVRTLQKSRAGGEKKSTI